MKDWFFFLLFFLLFFFFLSSSILISLLFTTLRYCMAYPRHALQSLEIPSVSQIRASDDYVPGFYPPSQWTIGSSSIFAHALGLAPFKVGY